MGLFDDIEVEPGVDLPDPPSTRQFQTKSLGCFLCKYRITADGRLVEERRDDRGVTDYDVGHHGDLRFYTDEGNRSDGTWKWYEYNARFTNGKLDRVTKALDQDRHDWTRVSDKLAHSSCEMGSTLKVQFGDPQHGWMVLTIQSRVRVVTLQMSYVGRDTLNEMIEGLHALITGDYYRSVRIMEEPTVCELRFSREDATIGLELHRLSPHNHRQTLLEASGSFAEICLPFWRALRNLQTRFPTEEFGVRWRRPFPLSGMEKLSANVRRLPR